MATLNLSGSRVGTEHESQQHLALTLGERDWRRLPAAAEAGAEGGALGGLEEVSAAVAVLDARERAELNEQTARVLSELQARLQQRLATL